MCTLLLAIQRHRDYPWIIAANRDEYLDRPTAPMSWWADRSGLLAGRDLRAGGTWLGVTRSGRFAAVTNYREVSCVYPRGPSRGALVSDYLTGTQSPKAFLAAAARQRHRFDGYNLVVGDVQSGLHYYGNRGLDPADEAQSAPVRLAPGLYGLSNHRLNTPWPKVQRGKALLTACLGHRGRDLEDRLLEALADTTLPADGDLPDTGVGLFWERILAPLFIRSPHYGTRSCSVVRLNRRGQFTVLERSFPQPGTSDGQPIDRRYQFRAAGIAGQND